MDSLKTRLQNIEKDFNQQLTPVSNSQQLTSLKTSFLGRKGHINQVFSQLSSTDKAKFGKDINRLKKTIEKKLTSSQKKLLQNKKGDTSFDPTIPGITPPSGHYHLISQTIEEAEQIFKTLGFIRRRYPEVESDWYYAEGLNIPKDHPARDDQETFYVKDEVVLTAHTSNGQLREMEKVKTPPIKMINIGKTYRRQASHTHSPMFHQFEGLLIDRDINITHLIGVTNFFAQSYFGPDRTTRLRPHHFQFTEPSFEVDISCNHCQGTGKVNGKTCNVCKSGWLELGGAGMVHPQVLKNGGIDPNKYSGFAFGWGIERIAMMKHNITDNLRDLYSTDINFLSQF